MSPTENDRPPFSAFQKIHVKKMPKIRIVENPAERKASSRPAQTPTGAQGSLDIIYDAVVIVDDVGQIIEVNARAQERFGYDRERFLQLKIGEILPSADEKLLQTLRRNVDEQRFSMLEGRCRTGDGQMFPAEIAVSAKRLEPLNGLCFFVRDITQRKQTDNLLVSVINAIRNSSNGIVITDSEWRIRFANFAFLALWGNAAGEVLEGQDLRQFFKAPEDVRKLEEKLAAGAVRQAELAAQKRDGSGFNVQVSAAANKDVESNLLGYVFSFEDITERRLMEDMKLRSDEQRLENEQIKVRLDTASTLSYTLNNPLQAILSMAEMEKRDDYKAPIRQIIGILEELHREEPLRKIVGPDGVSRYDIKAPERLMPCAENALLLVDDDPQILALFNRILTLTFPRMKVDHTPGGREAIRLYAEAHHAVVVMDAMMPGLNGNETFEEIRKLCVAKGWAIPHTIFCTGFHPTREILDIVGEGRQHALLPKPVSGEEFIAMVRRFL